jgi:rod shape-determining protein MreC
MRFSLKSFKKTNYFRSLSTIIFSAFLMYLDTNLFILEEIKKKLTSTSVFFFETVTLENKKIIDKYVNFKSRDQLLSEIEILEKNNLLLKSMISSQSILLIDIHNLRSLMELKKKSKQDIVIGEVVVYAPSATSKQFIINKGLKNGIEIGQAVVSDQGLLGQIINVNEINSVVSLISDSNRLVPVQIMRTGKFSVLKGTGDNNLLELIYISNKDDILEGDMIVTSGIDEVYPSGIPVARVNKVKKKQNDALAFVACEPHASLFSNKYVAIIKSK